MIVCEKGHIYELENKYKGTQRLSFFKDLPFDGEKHDGVLCQEVIRVLIDRMLELWQQKPCHESTEIIQKLRELLILFEVRAVRGTLEKSYPKTGLHIEQLPVLTNGHIFDLKNNKEIKNE